MSPVKVVIGVLLMLICVLFSLRFHGLSQSYQAYDHPLVKWPRPWILAWGGNVEQGPSHTRLALRGVHSMENVILAVNVEMNADKHFYLVPQGFLRSAGATSKKLIELSDEEVSRINLGQEEAPLRLEDALESYASKPLMLWINDNIENIDLRLQPILKKYSSRSQIIIHSEYDNVVKSIKKLLPQLLYGTGVGQRVRLLMLSSLWLEPIAPVDGDLLVSPLSTQGISVVSPKVRSEVERRQKVFILGPLNTPEANSEALSLGADGYLTAFPADLQNKLKESSRKVDLSEPSR